MSKFGEISISRRRLLIVVAAGTGLLILKPTAALGAEFDIPLPSTIETSPGAIENYVAATDMRGFTDIEGIHAEYREAAAIFPLVLPAGWSFPSSSSLRNTERDVQWERGSGVAELYFVWQTAVATEAYRAHLRGDSLASNRLLDTLEAGYDSAVRRAVLEDADSNFISVTIPGRPDVDDTGAVAAARRGDFATLKDVSIE